MRQGVYILQKEGFFFSKPLTKKGKKKIPMTIFSFFYSKNQVEFSKRGRELLKSSEEQKCLEYIKGENFLLEFIYPYKMIRKEYVIRL